MAELDYDELRHDGAMGNGCKPFSPTINDLIDEGVAIHYYYAFKLCSPTRASLMAGQYPWGAGFYDMSDGGDHCMTQYKILPAILKQVANYSTHTLGKWDIGFITKDCTPTCSEFESFLGYYSAYLADYRYHFTPDVYATACDLKGSYIDFSNSTTAPPESQGPLTSA
jgi:arylsulfatase A-like enzyme